MNTKKYINNKNKTKRNVKKNKNSVLLLSDIYIKNDSELNNEKRLACYLINNNSINQFAFDMFYYMLCYWEKYYPDKWKNIINHSLLERIDGKTIVNIGFNKSEIVNIFELFDKHNKKDFSNYLSNKFLKVTSCLNNLVEPEFTIYHVNVDKHLQNIFIKEVSQLMLLDNLKWTDIKHIYNNLKTDDERNLYNFFIFDIIYGSNKSINSIYRTNIGNMNFFRVRLNEFKHDKTNYKKINECNKSIIGNSEYSEYGIYNSTERYKITKHLPYAEIMNKFKEPYIGGPSGSTALMYIVLFQFYKYPFIFKNKILLLGMLIADYIPLWHTIPEILMSAYPEIKNKQIPEYNFTKGSVVPYVMKLLKKVL